MGSIPETPHTLRPLTKKELHLQAAKVFKNLPFDDKASENVLSEINGIRLNKSAQENLKLGLERFASSKAMIEKELIKKGMPSFLAAIPLTESNMKPDFHSPAQGAGVWGVTHFTAGLYGLAVEIDDDERLDIFKETQAMSHYLQVLQKQFGDWRLSVLGYRYGDGNIASALERCTSRDPWLIEKTALGSRNYLGKVVANILIIQDPSVVGLEINLKDSRTLLRH